MTIRPISQVIKTGVLRQSQHGLVLMVALITLVLMSMGAIALYRSTDIVTLQSGAVAFMMDSRNKSDLCVRRAISWMTDPASGLDISSGTDQPNFNYYGRQFSPAQMNVAHGVHARMLDSSGFGWMGAAPTIDAGGGVSMNCTIERLCQNTTAADISHCEMASLPLGGQGVSGMQQPSFGGAPAYRVTTRVDSIRGTQLHQVTITPEAL